MIRPGVVLSCAVLTALLCLSGCGDEQAMELEPIPPPADVGSPPADALRTGSGLRYKILVEGTGATPTLVDQVQVHYTGWTTDGEMFDSSVARGMPATFPVDAVIEGWVEGLQLMQEGGEYRLWIPEHLAYQGQPGRPAGMLIFDVELITVYPGG
jgi:peptidylprolyl isomerase